MQIGGGRGMSTSPAFPASTPATGSYHARRHVLAASRRRPTRQPLWRTALGGALAGCGACMFSNPVEVAKVRFQLSAELQVVGRVPYRGVLHCLLSIARDEGVWALQRGLGAALAFQVAMNGTRLGVYEPLQHLIAGAAEGSGLAEKEAALSSPLVKVVAGAAAGAMGAVPSSPMYLAKCRLMSQTSAANVAFRQQHAYSGGWDVVRTLYRQGGVAALFHGVRASALRSAVSSSAQLGTYDTARAFIDAYTPIENELAAQLAASLTSGVVVTTVMNPFDMALTRLYNAADGAYRGMTHTITASVRAEGLGALGKGWWASYCRNAPHTLATLLLWEQIKRVLYTN